jgi:hypothetical protein
MSRVLYNQMVNIILAAVVRWHTQSMMCDVQPIHGAIVK